VWYTITVNVTYADGGHGSAVLQFASDAPIGTLALKQAGTFFSGTVPGTNQLAAQLDNKIKI
jgi:hypothetical protein